TGRDVLHGSSDLDLLLRSAEPLPRAWARELRVLFEDLPCRVDLQLQTPQGGVALREWGGSARRVLLKCDAGARLVDNPWQPLEDVA
ncbi:phosphoribosyl-dephospho-CoA transferase MdcG domain-containing protein, partial [Metapseudomonas otitidis]|uniref:phosphoribosyl-dephospho-CoA transferase MdcG domain-containing protein n=1 Tax=Metapseudomonas otitidis TaxID=319939 RepID=UPI0023F9C46D